MYISIDIGQYLLWYWLLTIGLVIVGIIASYIHQTWIPLFWASIVGLVMILMQLYLTPIVFGVLEYNYQTQFFEWVLTGWFALAFFGYLGICCYNSIRYGEVWQ